MFDSTTPMFEPQLIPPGTHHAVGTRPDGAWWPAMPRQTGCFVDTTTFCVAAITSVSEQVPLDGGAVALDLQPWHDSDERAQSSWLTDVSLGYRCDILT